MLMAPARAAQMLPNGLVVPSAGHYKKAVTCGRCGRLDNACGCYDREETPAIERDWTVVKVETAEQAVDAYRPVLSPKDKLKQILNPDTSVLGQCYTCGNPKQSSYKHRVTGARFCVPCGVQHLLPES
jgi:hypothetical protein